MNLSANPPLSVPPTFVRLHSGVSSQFRLNANCGGGGYYPIPRSLYQADTVRSYSLLILSPVHYRFVSCRTRQLSQVKPRTVVYSKPTSVSSPVGARPERVRDP